MSEETELLKLKAAAYGPLLEVIGVCALCGIAINAGMQAVCDNKGCPTSLKRTTASWDEYYDRFDNGSR